MNAPTIQILCHDGTPLAQLSETRYSCPTCGAAWAVTVA